MKKLIATVAVLLCCSAAFAQTRVGDVTTIQTPSGQFINCFRTSINTVVCQ